MPIFYTENNWFQYVLIEDVFTGLRNAKYCRAFRYGQQFGLGGRRNNRTYASTTTTQAIRDHLIAQYQFRPVRRPMSEL